MSDDTLTLDETIHQPTRLRIMTLLAAQQPEGRVAYGFIQTNLGLTGGNLTIHLRKLEAAGYVAMSKEFIGAKPRTWVEATPGGRKAYAAYLESLRRLLDVGGGLGYEANVINLDDKNLFLLQGSDFARQLHIKRVRAKLHVVVPRDGAMLSDVDFFEPPRFVPGAKDAFARQM